ncbi:HEAT repeat domain-containing protein [Amycolatopsis sp. FBCC-B4732]|uniref:HEAT repeat domain-containing protein n=1 Tax=Amycolatopsis sp. FBCC-B4732 TaxID=3079339 RepID=UPI001FF21556|nr:HEAT repeat domain-containing protein [Amycolatopsis sp. FBCC-B4732]UOX86075.1 HEAT repeat domain-containing protein [Amycolatopsis sp. FBCC-B4732]
MNTASRNHDCRAGQEFRDGIDLPGWEEQSVWGWDPPAGSFFAQLWRNGSTGDEPDIWISGVDTVFRWPSGIVLEIVERTPESPAKVVAALGLAAPQPRLRDDAEVIALLRSAVDREKTALRRGAIHALGWTQGFAKTTPVLRGEWRGPRPTAAEVEAEHHLVTGALHRPGGDRDFLSGVDASLWWLLTRGSDTWFL